MNGFGRNFMYEMILTIFLLGIITWHFSSVFNRLSLLSDKVFHFADEIAFSGLFIFKNK